MRNQPSVTPPLNSADAQTWTMWLHLSGILGLLIFAGSLTLPLIMWRLRRERSDFVDQHGKEAVNFQLTWFLIGLLIAAGILLLTNFSKDETLSSDMILLNWLVNSVVIVCAGLAAIKANKGESYRYPLSIRFIK